MAVLAKAVRIFEDIWVAVLAKAVRIFEDILLAVVAKAEKTFEGWQVYPEKALLQTWISSSISSCRGAKKKVIGSHFVRGFS